MFHQKRTAELAQQESHATETDRLCITQKCAEGHTCVAPHLDSPFLSTRGKLATHEPLPPRKRRVLLVWALEVTSAAKLTLSSRADVISSALIEQPANRAGWVLDRRDQVAGPSTTTQLHACTNKRSMSMPAGCHMMAAANSKPGRNGCSALGC